MRLSGLTGLLLASVIAMNVMAGDQARDFMIPPQALRPALELFIQQSGVELLYDSDAVRNLRTGGVSGSHTIPEALERLLEDSGLTYTFTGPNTVAIRSGERIAERLERKQLHQDNDGTIRMPAMLITATRGETNIKDAPAAVTVMTTHDLEHRHVLTIDQALKATPGAFTRRSRGLMDTNASITFRGFPGQRRTMIMVDGLPLNDIYSADVNYSTIDLNNVEKIEVVRGPFSSLYGGNAMSGVVNVITRPVEDSGVTLNIGYGDAWSSGQAAENLLDIAIGARMRVTEAAGFSATYRYRTTDGYPSWFITRAYRTQNGVPAEPNIPADISGAIDTTTNSGTPTSIIGDAGYNSYSDDNLHLKADYRFPGGDELTLNLSSTGNRYDYGERNTYLRDANGNPVFSFAPGQTTSGATSGALTESSFLSGAPGGSSQNNYGMSYLHGKGEATGKLVLGHMELGKNWFVTPGLRPRAGTEDLYAVETRDGGRGLLSQSAASHSLIEYQLNLPLGRIHTLTAGAAHLYGEANNEEIALRNWRDTSTRGETRSRAGGKITTSSLFIQDRWRLSDRLAAYLGARQDWWRTENGYAYSFATVADSEGDFNDLDLSFPDRGVGQLSPKLALVYRHSTDTTWRASAGRSFRGPSVFELYRTWFSSTTGTEFRSNPELVPETAKSWEAGLDHTFANGTNLVATWFNNRMENFIYRLTAVEISPVSTFYNAAKASSEGLELSLTGNLGPVNWYANYTYTDAVIDEFPFAADPSQIEGKQIVQFPKHLANLGADWQRGKLRLGGLVHYSEERYNTDANTDIARGVFGSYDSPTLVDVRLGYLATDTVRFSIAIDNVFDREWYDFYRAPGRSWFAQVTVDI